MFGNMQINRNDLKVIRIIVVIVIVCLQLCENEKSQTHGHNQFYFLLNVNDTI